MVAPCRILLNSSEPTSVGVDSQTGRLLPCILNPLCWRKVFKGHFQCKHTCPERPVYSKELHDIFGNNHAIITPFKSTIDELRTIIVAYC